MKEYKFTSICVYPTLTLIAGKEYQVIDDDGAIITVINENGNKLAVMRNRFDKILYNEEIIMSKEIICDNSGDFKNLTKGKKYKIEDSSSTRFTVKNDRGIKASYSKKYFKSNVVKEAAVKKVKTPKHYAECLYAVSSELTFKKKYEYIEITATHIVLNNDKGVKSEYLRKRFINIQE